MARGGRAGAVLEEVFPREDAEATPGPIIQVKALPRASADLPQLAGGGLGGRLQASRHTQGRQRTTNKLAPALLANDADTATPEILTVCPATTSITAPDRASLFGGLRVGAKYAVHASYRSPSPRAFLCYRLRVGADRPQHASGASAIAR
ncbi:hypothetical protein MTO96_002655 [Rhipicephalus appendiculatus]